MLCFACGTYNILLTFSERDRETERFKFCDFWNDCEIKNLIHRNSCFLMKTSDLRKLLSKLREIN